MELGELLRSGRESLFGEIDLFELHQYSGTLKCLLTLLGTKGHGGKLWQTS